MTQCDLFPEILRDFEKLLDHKVSLAEARYTVKSKFLFVYVVDDLQDSLQWSIEVASTFIDKHFYFAIRQSLVRLRNHTAVRFKWWFNAHVDEIRNRFISGSPVSV